MVSEITEGLLFNHDPNKKQSIYVLYVPDLKILVKCLVKSTISQIYHAWHKCFKTENGLDSIFRVIINTHA